MLSAVSTRYARALLDAVLTPGGEATATKVMQDLRTVEQIIAESPSLRHALASPAVSAPKKRAVMRRMLEPAAVDRRVMNFVYVVIDHRRVSDLAAIADAFEILLDERLGYVAADIRSAHELTDQQRAGLETQISRLSGKKAKLKFSTDPALIAGVVAHVGSTVYDGSVRGQLERLRTKLGAS